MTNYNGPIRHHTRDCDPFAQEWNRIMDQLDHDRFEPLSFPPKTGPLFLETEGGCDGSETLFG